MITQVAKPLRLPASEAAAPIEDLPSFEHYYSSTRSQAAAPCNFGCYWPFLHHSQQRLEKQRLGWPSHCTFQLPLTTGFETMEQRLEGHCLRHLCYTGRVKGLQEPLEVSFN